MRESKKVNLSSENVYTIWWVSGAYCRHNMPNVMNYAHARMMFLKSLYVNKLDKEKHSLHRVQRKAMQIEVLSLYLSFFMEICGTLGRTLIFLQVMLLCASSCKSCIKYWPKLIFRVLNLSSFRDMPAKHPAFTPFHQFLLCWYFALTKFNLSNKNALCERTKDLGFCLSWICW